jgi:hypothetical protein
MSQVASVYPIFLAAHVRTLSQGPPTGACEVLARELIAPHHNLELPPHDNHDAVTSLHNSRTVLNHGDRIEDVG